MTHLTEDHEKRCGRKPKSIGFFADIVADCLTLPACLDAGAAYSVLETLRMATSQVLDKRLARYLEGKGLARKVEEDTSWFASK